MPSLSKTIRLATVGRTPACTTPAVNALRQCEDVAALAELAQNNRVAAWLASAIRSSPDLASDSKFAPIHAAAAAQSLQTLGLFAEMVRVLKEFNARAIPVVVLKGPAIADTYYPDAALRPYGDIDVLIHERDLKVVSELLHDRGYREKNAFDPAHRLHDCHGIFQRIFIHPETSRIVEVHCDHLQIGLEPVSMDVIWESAEDVRFGSAKARALEKHDLFVQLCVHLHRHGFERLIWFKDLDLMVRDGSLDWALVEAKAKEQGCLDSLSYTLWLLRKALGTPFPPQGLLALRKQSRISRTLHRLVWPERDVVRLLPQRQWRLRRIVQFAPETGFFRGGLPSLLLSGRRMDKLRVLRATALSVPKQ